MKNVFRRSVRRLIRALTPALLLQGAYAQTSGDDFNDNSKDTSKWGIDQRSSSAFLNEVNQRLEFTVNTATQDHYASRPWLGAVPVNTDWEATLNVFNTSSPSSSDITVGMQIFDPVTNEDLFIELYAFREGGVTERGFLTSLDGSDADTGHLGVTAAALKMAWNATQKVLSTSYDRDGAGTAFGWTPLGSFGLAGSGGATGNRNWNLPANGNFSLLVGGFSEFSLVPAGVAYMDDFKITVGQPGTPPVITTQPQNQSVNIGSAVTFSVAATGTPPLSYQWKFNDQILTNATFSSYTIRSAQPSHAGQYSVIVSNAAGFVTSSRAQLTVNQPSTAPTITVQPQSQSVLETSRVSFSVAASGTAPLSYQWIFGTSPIAGATSSSYTIANAQASQAGSYSVVVSNSFGSVTSAAAVLTVEPLIGSTSIDDFNDNNKDQNKWGTDIVTGNALLSEVNQRLEFTVPAVSTEEHLASRPWLRPVPVNVDWEATVNVFNTSSPSAGDITVGLQLQYGSVADNLFIELYALRETTLTRGFLTSLDDPVTTLERDSGNLGVTAGAVKMAWNATQKILTTSYDRDGAATAFGWTVLGTYGLGGSGGSTGNRNWNLPTTGNFTLTVGGFSESSTVPAGVAWVDDFQIKVGPATPPTIRLSNPRRGAGTSWTIPFTSNQPGAYTLWRATQAQGPWTSLGNVTLGQNLTGEFTDPQPPASAAFYKVQLSQ